MNSWNRQALWGRRDADRARARAWMRWLILVLGAAAATAAGVGAMIAEIEYIAHTIGGVASCPVP